MNTKLGRGPWKGVPESVRPWNFSSTSFWENPRVPSPSHSECQTLVMGPQFKKLPLGKHWCQARSEADLGRPRGALSVKHLVGFLIPYASQSCSTGNVFVLSAWKNLLTFDDSFSKFLPYFLSTRFAIKCCSKYKRHLWNYHSGLLVLVFNLVTLPWVLIFSLRPSNTLHKGPINSTLLLSLRPVPGERVCITVTGWVQDTRRSLGKHPWPAILPTPKGGAWQQQERENVAHLHCAGLLPWRIFAFFYQSNILVKGVSLYVFKISNSKKFLRWYSNQ